MEGDGAVRRRAREGRPGSRRAGSRAHAAAGRDVRHRARRA
jgi:hypothetical protein